MMPPPSRTDSTNTIAAAVTPGTRAKRQGLARAHRMARVDRSRSRAPDAATTRKATMPSDSAALIPPAPKWPPITCQPKSPRATTPPVTAAPVHGAWDIAAPETVISSRRSRPGSFICVVISAPLAVERPSPYSRHIAFAAAYHPEAVAGDAVWGRDGRSTAADMIISGGSEVFL